MNFEKRDLILIVASIFLMLGLSPFLGIAYAAVVAFLIYFGIKVFVGRQRQKILDATGKRGLCAHCGGKLEEEEEGKCPNCDSTSTNPT